MAQIYRESRSDNIYLSKSLYLLGGSQLAPPVVSCPTWSVMLLVIRRTM